MKRPILISTLRFFVTVGITCLLIGLLLRLWPSPQKSGYSTFHELKLIFITHGGRSFILIVLALLFSIGFTAFSFLFSARFHQAGLGIKFGFYLLSSIPTIFVGYLAVACFHKLGIDLVAIGDKAERWQYYLIPALVLGVGDGFLNEFIQHAEEEVEAIRRENYIRLAKAIGTSGLRRWWEYIQNDLMLRSSRVVFSRMTALISGTVVIEFVFGIPGLGLLVFDAAEKRYSLRLMLILLCMVIVVSLLNFMYRVMAVILDPRLR